MAPRLSPAATLEHALATRRILVACGSGGVGKTTTAAALALRAARAGRRVLACTIDPSRRLATSLGLQQLSGRPRPIDLVPSRARPRPRGGPVGHGPRREEHVRRARHALHARRRRPRAHPRQPLLPPDLRRPRRQPRVHGDGEAPRAPRGRALRPRRPRHAADAPRPRLPRGPRPPAGRPRHERPALVPAPVLRGRTADREGGHPHGRRRPAAWPTGSSGCSSSRTSPSSSSRSRACTMASRRGPRRCTRCCASRPRVS